MTDWIDGRVPTGLGGRFYGVYPALVLDLKDPDQQGRVKVALPWAVDPGGARFEAWARLATMMAGADRGSWFVPDAGDEVLVAFGGGDPAQPFVVGALWNGVDKPPARMDGAGDNKDKVLRSRSGVTVRLRDEGKTSGSFAVETPGGQKLTLRDSPAGVSLEDSNGNQLTMNSSGITLSTRGTLAFQAADVKIAAASVAVNTGNAAFSAGVTCQTMTAQTVLGAIVGPATGNIW